MKILHVTTLRALSPGQRKQLHHEVMASKSAGLQWDTVALHTEPPQTSFEKQVPRMWRSGLMLRLYRWRYVIEQARNYDLVLVRTLSFDILGPFLGLFARNRVTVHHSKEVEEVAILDRNHLSKRISIFVEKYLTPLAMRSARGLAGVASDIRDYEVERFPHLKGSAIVIPNGFHFAATQPSEDRRSASVITFTFVCGRFTEWHGLDRLLDAVKLANPEGEKLVRINLVGALNHAQKVSVQEVRVRGVEIIVHGVLDQDEVRSLLASTHVAIGSLALDRQNLFIGSTLKVREYLANGIPVYATHQDTALPPEFPFLYTDHKVSISRMVQFAESMADYSRPTVRSASEAYLDKQLILQKAVQDLVEIEGGE